MTSSGKTTDTYLPSKPLLCQRTTENCWVSSMPAFSVKKADHLTARKQNFSLMARHCSSLSLLLGWVQIFTRPVEHRAVPHRTHNLAWGCWVGWTNCLQRSGAGERPPSFEHGCQELMPRGDMRPRRAQGTACPTMSVRCAYSLQKQKKKVGYQACKEYLSYLPHSSSSQR